MSDPATPFMRQRWEDLLFCNWAVPDEALRPLVPEPLEIEVFDGSAWLSVVPMWMGEVSIGGRPPDPGVSGFPEVNVRTYVRFGGHAGNWFFSLDTAHQVTVDAGRGLFHLPYFIADTSMERGDENTFRSVRTDGTELDVSYGPVGTELKPEEGSVEHFLTERYSMFCFAPDGRMFRGDIEHDPWTVQPATVDVRSSGLVSALGVPLDAKPLALYAASIDVDFRPLVSV